MGGFSSQSEMKKTPQVEIQKIALVPHYHRGKRNRASHRVRDLQFLIAVITKNVTLRKRTLYDITANGSEGIFVKTS